MSSHISRTESTTKNYQNFLRSAEKTLVFTGSDTSDVHEWLVSVEEMADTHGADYDNVLRGLKSLLSKEGLQPGSIVSTSSSSKLRTRTGTVWFSAKSWFLHRFNPESRILRKVTEYHRCSQGRRSVTREAARLMHADAARGRQGGAAGSCGQCADRSSLALCHLCVQ